MKPPLKLAVIALLMLPALNAWAEDTALQPKAVVTKTQQDQPEALPNAAPQASDVADPQYPEGTLQPITLKSTLQKTASLPITLEQALSLAEGDNITIKLEEQNYETQRLAHDYNLSTLLPDVTPYYRQSRFVGATQIFGGNTLQIFRTTVQPQLTVNYTVYTGGANIFGLRASRQRRDAQQRMLENTRQNILRDVAIAYYDLQLAYWQRAIALQSIKEAQLQVDLNQALMDNGVGLKLNLLQSQSFLYQRRQDLLKAENQISKTSQHVAQLLNIDLNVDIVPAGLESSIHPVIPDEMPFDQIVSRAITDNPNLQQLRLLRDAGKTDVKVAVASIFPQINLTAYANETGISVGNWGLGRFAGLEASSTVFDNMGLGTVLKIKQIKSQAKANELTLDQAESFLKEQLANTLVDVKTLNEAIEVAKVGLDYSRQAYLNAYGRRKAGVGTNIDVENAMTSLMQARTNLANAFLNYNKAQVLLLGLMGQVSRNHLVAGYEAGPTMAPAH